jgi:integrase
MRGVLPNNQITEYFRQADMLLDEPVRSAAMLLPCCGLRASEIVGLALEDIHRAFIKVNGKKRPTLYLRVRGKGGKERHVPLLEEGVEILTGYLAGWRRRQPGTWLFPTTYGGKVAKKGKKHIGDRTLRGGVQKLCEPLGLKFTPHTMRRTYVTTLWRKGIDLATLARIVGHANVQTTVDHYISMEPQDVLQAVHEAGSSLTE